ncbi:hypothetical protein BC835DRAFT_674509 [Cytidiella melzeri]|nr:hypothetical protein BC835DRAFT_674509 [Cytidiella melzeri]
MAAQVVVLSTVTAPLYSSMDFYPTSPIQTFPPPLPARQTLRVRCGITMRLHLSTHGLTSPMTGWSPKGHVQPHRHNLPRRRNPKRVAVLDREHDEDDARALAKKIVSEDVNPLELKQFSPTHVQPTRNSLPRRRKAHRIVVHDIDGDEEEVVTSKPMSEQGIIPTRAHITPSYPPIEAPYIPSTNTVDSQLQSLLPNVFMAFSDSTTSLDDLPGLSSAEPYTHVVHVGYSDEEAHSCERTTEGETQYLHLDLPSSARTTGASRLSLELTDAQLHAAREFMAEALPHLDISTGARMLVTGPHGRPTDVVSIAACYFAFVSGKSIEDILLFIDAEEDFLSTWKGEVTEDEADKLQRIAQA